MQYQLHHGDCLAVLAEMPDSSVDSIVTDPPYELGFMGKSWDASGIAYNVDMWREALRVLKPGGHLLAFSGSRTYHRMVVAIEDAGFEIRDQIMWVYGSGFPKSLDVSKAIDKTGGNPLAFRLFADAYASAIAASPMTHADIDRALGIKSSSCYWARSDHRGGMPPRHHWEQVCALLPLPKELAAAYDEAEREVIGQKTAGMGSGDTFGMLQAEGRNDQATKVLDVTAPATDAARQWEGWGTALKPAHEPICVARKPLVGTVAANVLEFGTGALNIDGCRVDGGARPLRVNDGAKDENGFGNKGSGMAVGETTAGRWPANLIHDGSDEVLAAFPDAKGQQGATAARSQGDVYGSVNAGQVGVEPRNDAGSAARFFYCAKASKSDRGACNNHPTVKPTDLMAYLCRLVTPPGGLVLDPFMGSGSTGKAAMREGFRFAGIDMTADYVEIARARIEHALFGDLL